ncbi:hydroxyacid dehydrogenase [Microbacterium sp. Leaf320]|uniref:hydroxyacid dehydrogenase n=1 Tax=Microbacterium sp. Leaf320 TaxID=1736334 RepID=UPI0012F8685B|nr:hydroxyacid dehydrogenase [Microbacterium sp. Leaf320]
MTADVAEEIFPPRERDTFAPELLLLADAPLGSFAADRSLSILRETEVLITSWGSPVIDATVLNSAPALRAIVHAGGSVKQHLTEEVWRRGIIVSSATAANALPVAEYTLAMILLANKDVIGISRHLSRTEAFDPRKDLDPRIGNFGKRIGLVGASTIGRRVIDLLQPFDLEVVVADPYLSDADASLLGVQRVSLEELARSSDVVSLHAPALPSTHHLFNSKLIRTLKPGATLINTARGSLVDQQALTDRLAFGDISAILDVTDPWIPVSGDRLYTLPNVFLSPHIAGSLGTELRRLSTTAVAEAKRISSGLTPHHPVGIGDLARIA